MEFESRTLSGESWKCLREGSYQYFAERHLELNSTTYNPPADLMFSRQMRMPIEFLQLDPSEPHASFNIDKPLPVLMRSPRNTRANTKQELR